MITAPERKAVKQWIGSHERRHFETEGYMVLRSVIPRSTCAAAVGQIAAFIGADLTNPSTWYRSNPQLDGVVPIHHSPAQWEIRQSPDLYAIFTEFFDYPYLMVDINRCIFRPPVNPAIPGISHGTIHWDTDPRSPAPPTVQAVILLTDVGHNGGGFQCIPGIFQNLEEWLHQNAAAPDFDFFNPGLNDYPATQVPGHAGDVILWSTQLPHGSATNLSAHPRVATFVTMQPPADSLELRAAMHSWWLTRRAPVHWRGLPGQMDPEPGSPAPLTELGQKLIGLAPW